VNTLLEWMVAVQTAIHRSVSEHISAYSASGDWGVLYGILPMAVLFGFVHAFTPGHNKLVLATYVVGDRMAMLKATAVAAALALTHIGSAVIIALVASFLVSRTMTNAGQVPLLENLSRWLLVGIGVWLVRRAVRGKPHIHGEGVGFGIVAGLVPCPLTLFIMVFAVSQGVPEAGLTFAVAMLIGVGTVLIATSLLALSLGRLLETAMLRHGNTLSMVSRSLEIVAGLVLTTIALMGLLR
jgi:nickel/cobalt transporter (NicO) family protein